MFIWRLWGGAWYAGDTADFLTFLIVNFLILCFLVALTLAILILWLPFMGIKWAWGQLQAPTTIPAAPHVGATPPTLPAMLRSCPHCGNTASRDIRPCIRCGN
jgi:hypothetical protein